MRVWAEINLDNLENNVRIIKKISGGKNILGVVKADAYGHGAIEIAKELKSNGVDFFGVACIDEAEELFENGIKDSILILGCTPIEDWSKAVSLGIHLTMSSKEELFYLEKNGLYPKVHIKIDTGMGRIGFTPEEGIKIIKYIKENKIAKICGIFSHFSSADDDVSYTNEQLKIFKKIEEQFPEIQIKHISNSAAIANLDCGYNYIRPGIILYGVVPFETSLKNEFKPVMYLKSKIVFLKEIKDTVFISYGKTYKAEKGDKIATVSAGYADGVNRKLSNRGVVVVKGVKCPIVGRICMDQFMIKIPEEISDILIGEEVTIFGEIITAEDVARDSETISYEILTNISVRVPRVYKKNNSIVEIKSLLGRKIF